MEGRSLNLWHALRQECAGAWRSARYDLASHRATKLGGAFTEEFEPTAPSVRPPSRVVPLTGVTLLLAGGAAGAFLAISGGLAAVGDPEGPSLAQGYAATATAPAGTAAAAGTGGGATPVTPRLPAAPRPSQSPAPGATTPPPPPPPPVTEGSSLPPSSASASASASDPAPSASQSSQSDTDGSRSRGHRGRR